jgi:hydroxyacylglutathione hydrolase
MGLKICTIVNTPVPSNCYVIFQQEGKKAIIIDPGSSECHDLLIFLNEKNLTPEYIFLTHEHFDHIAGVNKLKSIFDIKVLAHSICAERIIDKKKNLSVFFDQNGFEVTGVDIFVDSENDVMEWYTHQFQFYYTPGHSEGSMAICINNYLFVGDTIILGEKTVTKLPGGSRADLIKSLNKIEILNESKEMKIFPGHGATFNLDDQILKVAIDGC